MKTLFTFILILTSMITALHAQQEAFVKGRAGDSRISSPLKEVNADVPMTELMDGGANYAPMRYYGEPSGIYLDPAWKEGRVILADSSVLAGEFRFNLYSRKMEAIIAGDTFSFGDPYEISMLETDGRRFVFCDFERPGYRAAGGWFELLSGDRCRLLLRRYIKYRIDDGDGDPSNDKLYRLEDYYVDMGEPPATLLHPGKKAVLEMFPSGRDKIESFMKQEKLRLRERADLVRLFDYYNSLP
jgi:hypothetical protein